MMIWLKFGANPALFWLIATLLVVWGVFFNAVTAYSERKRWTEGYLSLYVMAGVAGTLVGVAFIDLGAALLCAAGFICTGTPMIVGSVWRHMRRREDEQRAARREAYAIETERVAKQGQVREGRERDSGE